MNDQALAKAAGTVSGIRTYKISASKLSCAESCQLQFFHKYVAHNKVNTDQFPALPVGTAFHSLVEWMYTRKVWELEEILKWVDSAWSGAMAKARLSEYDRTPERQEVHKQKIVKLFKRFHKQHTKIKLLGKDAAGIENPFNIEWIPSKDPLFEKNKDLLNTKIIINGYIDRIMVLDGKAWITDWKTTSNIPEEEEVHSNIQLTFYSAAYRYLAARRLKKDWPKTEEYAELYFPKIADSIKTTRSKKDFVDMKERLILVTEIEKNKLQKAMPSEDACRWCDYKGTQFCPATLHGGLLK